MLHLILGIVAIGFMDQQLPKYVRQSYTPSTQTMVIGLDRKNVLSKEQLQITNIVI